MIVKDNRTGVEEFRGNLVLLDMWQGSVTLTLDTGFSILLEKKDMDKLLAQEVLEKLKGDR